MKKIQFGDVCDVIFVVLTFGSVVVTLLGLMIALSCTR